MKGLFRFAALSLFSLLGPSICMSANADGFVYVTNTFSQNVSVIDRATNTVVATVSVGDNPEGVAVTPDGTSVFVTNNNSN